MRGVTIGKVSAISIAADQRLVKVEAELYQDLLEAMGLHEVDEDEGSVPIRRPEELRVQISTTGITGVKFLLVDYFDDPDPPVELDFEPPYNYVPSIPSTLKDLEAGIHSIARQLPGLMERADLLFATTQNKLDGFDLSPVLDRAGSFLDRANAAMELDASGQPAVVTEVLASLADLRRILASAEGFLADLEGESGGVVSAISSLKGAGERVAVLADKAGGLVEKLEVLSDSGVNALEQAELGSTTKSVRELAERLTKLADEGALTLASLRRVSDASSELPQDTSRAIGELRLALESIRKLTDYFERQPGALLRGRVKESSSPGSAPK